MNTHDIELPKPFMTVYDDVDKVEVGCYSEIQVRAAIEADRKRRGEPVAWTLNQYQVVALAEELIVGASTVGGMDDDGTECDVRLMVLMPGTCVDDDGKTNSQPILAFCLEDYPEEGVYPIDPAECHPQAAPQPADPSGASTLHNADSGAQDGIQAPQPAEPEKGPSMRELITDDAYATTFQSIGQYRKALLEAAPEVKP